MWPSAARHFRRDSAHRCTSLTDSKFPVAVKEGGTEIAHWGSLTADDIRDMSQVGHGLGF